MILELIKDLHQAGLEPTAEELADIFWLSAHVLDEATPLSDANTVDDTDKTAPKGSKDNERPLPEPETSTTQQGEQQKTQVTGSSNRGRSTSNELFLPDKTGDEEGESDWGGEPFLAPTAAALPGKLTLARALRPLKRRINSRLREELDVDETVRLSAEIRTLMPVSRPTRVRWLDLVLVVDEWSSMVIWQQTIAELRRMLAQQGAFRNIVMLGFTTAPNVETVQLHYGTGHGTQRHRARKAKQLLDPSGETLVLVISDCISPAWYNGQVLEMLKVWSGRTGKLALVQMLPERLWNRTALGDWLDAPLRARQIGLPNHKLDVEWPRRWRRQKEKPKQVLKIPVLTLEPESLHQWALSVAGNGNLWVNGRVLLLADTNDSDSTDPPQNRQRPAAQRQEPGERLEHFWATASPIARKLAGYLAAAPLSLPTMRLIQQVMVKDARQVHLAEVFLGGVLKHLTSFDPDKDPNDFRYDFLTEEIRKRLLEGIDVYDRLDVLKQVTYFVDRHTGQAMSFQAVLAAPELLHNIDIGEKSQAFAAVAALVLESMGRPFAPVAEQFRELSAGRIVADNKRIGQVKEPYDSNINESSTPHTIWPDITTRGTHYALLIGIDHYFEYRLPGGLYYPKLGGCVNDVNKIYNFMTARLKIDPGNIIRLTASLGGAEPIEPKVEWPTYTNIIRAFERLTEVVSSGCQVYIHYSGHGGRTTTMFPAIKGDGEFDEGLVPLDIGKQDDPNARYLRDVEIHTLLNRLVDKGVQLTIIFDCCYSGGATRGLGGARKRSISGVDTSPAPADSKVAPLNELISKWKEVNATTSKGIQARSERRFETKGYTLFAACHDNESAFEYPFNGRESNGALTYWLLDTWSKASSNYTWKMLADQVAARVNDLFSAQRPVLEGEVDYKVFGHDRMNDQFTVAVLEVNRNRRAVRLAAGEAHGLSEGTQFAVYPVETMDFDDPDMALAVLELTEVQAVESQAKVSDGQISMIEVGAQAVMFASFIVRLQRDVRIQIDDISLQKEVEAAIMKLGQGFVTLAEGDTDEFVVQVWNGAFVITDTTGEPLRYLHPPLQVGVPGTIEQLVHRLVHLVKFRNVLMLDMPDPTMRSKLMVELQPSRDVVRSGERVAIKITNTQAPNPQDSNDPSRVLNVAVLVLSSDWKVTQVYPENAASEIVDPGNSIDLEFEAYLPEGETESHDIFKVFATRDTTDFRWLELPALDQPPLARSIKRSAIADPLEALLVTVTGEEATTRSIRLTKSTSARRSWITTRVEMRVVS